MTRSPETRHEAALCMLEANLKVALKHNWALNDDFAPGRVSQRVVAHLRHRLQPEGQQGQGPAHCPRELLQTQKSFEQLDECLRTPGAQDKLLRAPALTSGFMTIRLSECSPAHGGALHTETEGCDATAHRLG